MNVTSQRPLPSQEDFEVSVYVHVPRRPLVMSVLKAASTWGWINGFQRCDKKPLAELLQIAVCACEVTLLHPTREYYWYVSSELCLQVQCTSPLCPGEVLPRTACSRVVWKGFQRKTLSDVAPV